MARKIYIGKTYRTKFNTEFTVVKVIKGRSSNSTDRRAKQPRRAVNKDGETIKITNLCTCQFGKVGSEELCTVCEGYSIWKDTHTHEKIRSSIDGLYFCGKCGIPMHR